MSQWDWLKINHDALESLAAITVILGALAVFFGALGTLVWFLFKKAVHAVPPKPQVEKRGSNRPDTGKPSKAPKNKPPRKRSG